VIAASPQVTTSGFLNVQATSGMIRCFTVLDVYMDGANAFSVDTDLPALPNTAVTATGTVAGNTLTVTAISPTDAVLLVGMGVTGGSLPGGTTITDNSPGIPGSALHSYTLSNSAAVGTPTPFTCTVPMIYSPHPCPRFTVINCSGGRTVTDMNGAPPDLPLYSWFRRVFAGLNVNVITSEPRTRLAGNLVSLTVNVVRPYTGAAASYQFAISFFGYKTAGGITYPTAMGQIVNLKTAGVRTVTFTATSGAASGDTLTPMPIFISGAQFLNVGPTLDGADTLATMPYFIVTAQTDQGIYPSMTIDAHSGVDYFADTVIKANALF
jgi:hypothetical protein